MQLSTAASHTDHEDREVDIDGSTAFCQHADQMSFFPGTPLEALMAGARSMDEFRPDIFA